MTRVRLVAIAVAMIALLTASAHAQPGGDAPVVFPSGGTRVPLEEGSTCAGFVQAAERGTLFNANQTAAGTPRHDTSQQAQTDEQAIVSLLRGLLARSAEMRRKMRGACDRLGGHVMIYLLRDDPHVVTDPVGVLTGANVMFIDLGAIERRIRNIATPGNEDPQQQERARLRFAELLWVAMIIVHEMHHLWTGEDDPRGFGEKGGAVENENRVAREAGFANFERQAYKQVDANGRSYIPYVVEGVQLRFVGGPARVQKQGTTQRYCCSLDDEDHDLIERVDELDASADPRTPQTAGGWHLGLFGGLASIGNSSSGTAVSLPAGQSFNAANGFPSVLHPSWATSAGVALLREVLESKGITPTAEAIDAILAGGSVASGSGVVLGVLLSRSVTDALSIWTEMRIARSSFAFTDSALAQAERTRASVEADLTTLLADTGGAFVDSVLTGQPGAGTLVTIGAGFEYCFMDQQVGGWHPSVRAGVGYTLHTGDQPGLTLTTEYGFPLGGLSYRETDTLVIEAATRGSFGLQFGGALRRPLNDRARLFVDVMISLEANRTAIEVTAAPARNESGSSGAATFPVDPTIQFGQGMAPSSLGGALDGFTGFQGTGWGRFSSRIAAGVEFDF